MLARVCVLLGIDRPVRPAGRSVPTRSAPARLEGLALGSVIGGRADGGLGPASSGAPPGPGIARRAGRPSAARAGSRSGAGRRSGGRPGGPGGSGARPCPCPRAALAKGIARGPRALGVGTPRAARRGWLRRSRAAPAWPVTRARDGAARRSRREPLVGGLNREETGQRPFARTIGVVGLDELAIGSLDLCRRGTGLEPESSIWVGS